MKTIDRLNNLRNALIGKHRLEVDENWPKVKLEHIETDRQMLIARLIGNMCRRLVSSEEKCMLAQLGEIYLKEGIERGEIAYKIAEGIGISYRWVMKYLPDKFKARPGFGGPSKALSFDKHKEKTQKSKVALYATLDNEFSFSDPQQKILTIKNYANTKFVNIVLEKRFYMKFQNIAEKLGTKPDVIINNVLLLTLRRLECMAK